MWSWPVSSRYHPTGFTAIHCMCLLIKKSCWFILFKTIHKWHKWHINCIIHILGFSHQFTITIISPKMVVDCTIFQYIYLKQTMTVATHEQSPHHWRWLWITISAGEPQILVILFVFCFVCPNDLTKYTWLIHWKQISWYHEISWYNDAVSGISGGEGLLTVHQMQIHH